VDRAIGRELSVATLRLDLSRAQPAVASLAPFAGHPGWMVCGRLHATSLREEQHLVFAGVADDGARLDADQCRRLMGLGVLRSDPYTGPISATLDAARSDALAAVLGEVDRRNAAWYDEEVAKLDAWAADLRVSLERELKDLDRQIDVRHRRWRRWRRSWKGNDGRRNWNGSERRNDVRCMTRRIRSPLAETR
jgi:hypothetical protein